MKEIRFGDSSHVMRFEYPDTWAGDEITEVLLSLVNSSGSSVIDEESCTIYGGTTLGSDATRGTNTVTLAAGADAVNPGDRLMISDSDDGPSEVITVYAYNSSTRVVTTEIDLLSSHSSGTAVTGMWATYTADFSASSYTAGSEYVAKWDADIDAVPAQEMFRIAAQASGLAQFWNDFKASYPVAWEMAKDRDLELLEHNITKAFQVDFAAQGKNHKRITDSDLMQHGVLLKANQFILGSGGDQYQVEYERAEKIYKSWFLSLMDNSSLWFDGDQDMIKDDEEIGTIEYSPIDRFL